MLNRSSLVSLVAVSWTDHSVVEVLVDEIGLQFAFAVAGVYPEDHMIVALPLGVSWGDLSVGDSFYAYDDDNTADVACFAGPEEGWADSSTVVWEDGGSRAFVPND